MRHDVLAFASLLVLRVLCPVTYFFFQGEDGIRDSSVTGVQTCALPISSNKLAREWGTQHALVVRHSLFGGRSNHVNRSKVPVYTHRSWSHGECRLVAESAEPENPSQELASVRSHGQGVQLRGRVQKPRPGRRDQGPACLDDRLAGVGASRLRPLWPPSNSHGGPRRGYVPERRRPLRGGVRARGAV